MTIDYTGCTRGEAQQVSTAPTATPIPKRLIDAYIGHHVLPHTPLHETPHVV